MHAARGTRSERAAFWATAGAAVVLVAWVGVWAASYARPIAVPLGGGPAAARFVTVTGGEVGVVVQRAVRPAGPGVTVDCATLGSLSVKVVEAGPGGTAAVTTTTTTREASVVVAPDGVGPADPVVGFGRVTMRPALAMMAAGGPLVVAMTVDGWAVPCWAVAGGLSGFGGLVGRRAWRLRRWRAEGRCAKCGYDLRATTDRCPECGVIRAEPRAQQAVRRGGG